MSHNLASLSDSGVQHTSPAVLVVHCIDTEGPLGGDARRYPDGSKEFFDTWDDIAVSLREITDPPFRQQYVDSLGNAYRYNWFIMDFTGFKTNPKCRVAEYQDTYDHLKALNTGIDGFYWHYHAPPTSGIGDQWAESWLDSNEHNIILARRLLERGDFHAAFRAGGTIEDEPSSHWLEQVFPIDYSNRVSHRSTPGADLFHFNWYGAPPLWGSYHPHHADLLKPGSMERVIYRCLDLVSRYNTIEQYDVDECFAMARYYQRDVVFSYFSHDTRDMRPETYSIYEKLQAGAQTYGIPWISCTALQAHQLYHQMQPEKVRVEVEPAEKGLLITTDRAPFQKLPFVAAQLTNGRFVRLYPNPLSDKEWWLPVDLGLLERLGVGVTSRTGDKALCVGDIVLQGSGYGFQEDTRV
jgi:hypothetical protein